MKKLILILVLSILIGGAAFANHPSGWGIGIVGQYGLAWDGFAGRPGAALSLKAPSMPIYWGIGLDFETDYYGVSLTGDYLLIDQIIVRDVNFGWFIGLGGYGGINFRTAGNDTTMGLGFGARVPFGIYIIPVNFFEIFLDIAPSLGVSMALGDNSNFKFPAGGLGFEIGLRLWL